MSTDTLQPLELIEEPEARDRALLEFTLPMPDWLGAAPQSVRDQYSAQLIAYHGCAARLEAHLDEVLPSFQDFVLERLRTRIKADLGIDISPGAVTIELPKRVWRDYDIDPQFGRVKSYSAPWVASTERERFSLPELTQRNFHPDDEQMARRFAFAGIEVDHPAPPEGLTAEYLHTLIPQLDVAQGYRTRLREIFRVPPMLSEQGQLDADLLLEPYERQIQLQAFCEFVRRRLSEEGYQLLTLAAQARSRAETDAAGLEMNWLEFKPGVSVSGEHDSHTLSGLCLIRDRLTNRSLIYLPDAPMDIVAIEAADPGHALSRLIEHLNSKPPLIDYLAERTLDTQNTAQHVSYINQALARRFEGFIRCVPALDLQPAAQQLHARASILHRMSRAGARSRFDLDTERNAQRNETILMYFKSLLGLLPGIGTLVSLQDGWRDGHDAAQAFREGRNDDALLALGSTALSLLDVVFSVVPGVVTVCLMARIGRRGAGLRSAATATRWPVLKPFEGYEVQTTLTGARPQTGRDSGTLLKDGQLWIQRENRVYAVYRRPGEQTLRLKKTAQHGYEPPVRVDSGRWVYHSDVGLKGGVRSAVAETLIAQAHGDPAFKGRHARQLLDQYRFPPERQRRLELDIAVHYQQHRAVPDWAEAFRRPQLPETAAQPGPSGVKRKDPPTRENPQRSAAESAPGAASVAAALADAPAGPESWKGWARPVGDVEALQHVEVHPPIFRLAAEHDRRFIEMDGSWYDILPSGASQHPTIVFLKNPNAFEDSFSGLNQTLRANRYDQPVMASCEAGRWTVHGPLFKKKLELLVEQARPGMTPTTNRILAEKIYESADPAHTGLTGTRLINIRATLNAWQKGELAPLSGLNDPLLLLEGSRATGVGTAHPRIRLSYGPSLEPFNRLDFTASEPRLASLLNAVTSGPHYGMTARTNVREFMSALMSRAGYSMVSADEAVLRTRLILLFRRPGQEQLYMMKMRYFSGVCWDLNIQDGDRTLPLSNRWIDEWLSAHPDDNALKVLVEARDQGRLVKLVGGVKMGSSMHAGAQVFVQRVAGDF